MSDNTTFYKLSGLFFTDYYRRDEITSMLDKGKALPVCQAFEDWDPDYLLKFIDQAVEAVDNLNEL